MSNITYSGGTSSSMPAFTLAGNLSSISAPLQTLLIDRTPSGFLQDSINTSVLSVAQTYNVNPNVINNTATLTLGTVMAATGSTSAILFDPGFQTFSQIGSTFGSGDFVNLPAGTSFYGNGTLASYNPVATLVNRGTVNAVINGDHVNGLAGSGYIIPPKGLVTFFSEGSGTNAQWFSSATLAGDVATTDTSMINKIQPGVVTGGAVGTSKLAQHTVAYSNIQSVAPLALLGNGSGSAGMVGEILLGANLSISNWNGVSGTLNATGGSGGGGVSSVVAGTGLTGGTITTSGTIALGTSGAVPGTYNQVVVDSFGRVTLGTLLNVLFSSGPVSALSIPVFTDTTGTAFTSTGITIDPSNNITGAGTVTASALFVGTNQVASGTTAVIPGSYGGTINIPNIVVDQFGRITSAANITASFIGSNQITGSSALAFSGTSLGVVVDGSTILNTSGTLHAPAGGIPYIAGSGTATNTGGTGALGMGNNANANGNFSVAIGAGAVTNGLGAIAIGDGANGGGAEGIAIGLGAVSSQNGAMAIGPGANSNGINSIVVSTTGGTTSGSNAIVIGSGVASAANSIVLGSGTASSPGQVVINGTTWTNGTGTVTEVDLGLGLQGGPIVGSGTISFKFPIFVNGLNATSSGLFVGIQQFGGLYIGSNVPVIQGGGPGQGLYVNYSNLNVGTAIGTADLIALQQGGGTTITQTTIGSLASFIGSTATPSFVAGQGTATAGGAPFGVALGNNAVVSAIQSVAVGGNSLASGSSTIAIGQSATASGGASMAIGVGAVGSGNNSLAIGNSASVVGSNAVALGQSSVGVNGNAGVAIGLANVTAFSGIAIGNSADVTGSYCIAIGSRATSQGTKCIVIGDTILGTASVGTTVIGFGTATLTIDGTGNLTAHNLSGTNTGDQLYIAGTGTAILGVGISASGLAIGNAATLQAVGTPIGGVAIGGSASAWDDKSVAIGVNSTAISNSIAIGGSSKILGNGFNIAIGPGASAGLNILNSTGVIAIGAGAVATGFDSITIGVGNGTVTGASAVSIGAYGTANAPGAIAISQSAYQAIGSLIGGGALASGNASIVIGGGTGTNQAVASANNSIVIGYGTANTAGQVVINGTTWTNGTGTLTSITAGSGLTGGTISTTGTLAVGLGTSGYGGFSGAGISIDSSGIYAQVRAASGIGVASDGLFLNWNDNLDNTGGGAIGGSIGVHVSGTGGIANTISGNRSPLYLNFSTLPLNNNIGLSDNIPFYSGTDARAEQMTFGSFLFDIAGNICAASQTIVANVGSIEVKYGANGGISTYGGTHGIGLNLAGLAAGTAIGDTDIIAISQSGVTVNASVGDLAAFLTDDFATRNASAPASATASGVLGQYFVDSSFAYFCIATNTWVRVAVATW